MLRIGLTGGIGSGKSAAAERFANLGVPVFDADIAAREVVEPGSPALRAIANHFGANTLLPDGALDRRALRNIVFSNRTEKQWLEALLHPLIRNRLREQLQACQADYALLVSPLLLETDQHELVDRVLLIDCAPATQIARVTARDATDADQVQRIMDSQIPAASRRARADDVIENDGSLAGLHERIDVQHARYLELAGVAG